MPGLPLLGVVVDTSVVFEGLTKQGGASGLIIDAWLAELMVVCVSNVERIPGKRNLGNECIIVVPVDR